MRRKPELLAPAGSPEALRVALASGADAVYFGLDIGFNARARATNIALGDLQATVAAIHRAGARAYLTLNTVVFEPELPAAEAAIRQALAAGVDALIVQDPAVLLLAREICPDVELHASTQMTISSPEAALFAADLGVTRVVVPRELSVSEVRDFAERSPLELEVFIHGALCVSWSGQCLTGEARSGRSANRGQCDQACRLPYDLMIDGRPRDLGDVRYLLSPKDLAGFRAVEDLIDAGVHGLKIEGRQKGPEYVATAVAGYRMWIDAVMDGRVAEEEPALGAHLHDMSLAYTRGFGDGFLAGSDHQTLVEGRFPKHRGLCLGRVVEVRGSEVTVAPHPDDRPWTGGLAADGGRSAPVGRVSSPLEGLGGSPDAAGGPATPRPDIRPGHGVVFDAGDPERKDEPGGPVFRVEQREDLLVLGFGRPGPDLARVRPGHRVWVTSDPEIGRRVGRLAGAPPSGRHPLHLVVTGAAGSPLRVAGESGPLAAHVSSVSLLTMARGAGIDGDLLTEKLGALGGTPFHLAKLDAGALPSGLHLPVSELKALRRRLVEDLTARVEAGPVRTIRADPALPRVRSRLEAAAPALPPAGGPLLVPLCRRDAQLTAVIGVGLEEVELDWMEMTGLAHAVGRAREAGLRVTVATVRVQKPGEQGYDRRLAALEPDGVLVRHWGALMHFRERPSGTPAPTLHGDFSLNVTNALTARHLLAAGLADVTAAHDLDAAQLAALLDAVPPDRVTVALHHHMATFHTEHCVYAHLLSEGRDFNTCGRPCEAREVSLRDPAGLEHPVIVDVACRNTVFHAQAQSAASLVPDLLERGVKRFRVEFVREDQEEAALVLDAYGRLLAGALRPQEAVARLRVLERFGITPGTVAIRV